MLTTLPFITNVNGLCMQLLAISLQGRVIILKDTEAGNVHRSSGFDEGWGRGGQEGAPSGAACGLVDQGIGHTSRASSAAQPMQMPAHDQAPIRRCTTKG